MSVTNPRCLVYHPTSVVLTLLRTSIAGVLLAAAMVAQSPSPAATPVVTTPSPAFDVASLLARIDQSAQSAALQIASLRIEKWKTEGEYKRQAQANADSLQRNLTNALPTLTNGVRSAPQDLSANFKLYRNLSALSDVLNTLAESAGAFGPRQDFQGLAQQATLIDEARRALGDYFELLAANKDAELSRLKSAATAAQPAVRPKKIIVDNVPDPPKSKKKRQ